MKLQGNCFRFLLSTEDTSVAYFDNLKCVVGHYAVHNKMQFKISVCKFCIVVILNMYPTSD